VSVICDACCCHLLMTLMFFSFLTSSSITISPLFNTTMNGMETTTGTVASSVKPIYVNILNSSSLTLVADRKYEIHCVTSGSRPDAIITWMKGKKSLKRIRDYSKNNQTTSILNFVPSIEDNGKTLTCHAENPNVPGMFLEDNWSMSVNCECLCGES